MKLLRTCSIELAVALALLMVVQAGVFAFIEQLPPGELTARADTVSMGKAPDITTSKEGQGGDFASAKQLTSAAAWTSDNTSLKELTNGADSVIVGTVVERSSYWNDEHTGIYTWVVLSVDETLKGKKGKARITVTLPGGEVDGIGQWVSDMANFDHGEKAVVFLKKLSKEQIPKVKAKEQLSEEQFEVYRGFRGKFTIKQGRVGNLSEAEFKERVGKVVRGQVLSEEELDVPSSPVTFPYSYAGFCWPHPPNPVVNYRINENTADCTSEGAAVQSAATTWSAAGAKFSFNYAGTTTTTAYVYNGVNDILWRNLGSTGPIAHALIWYSGSTILENDMEFNDYYTWSTAATPPSGQYDTQTIALHEFGHFLCLNDLYSAADSAKVMYGYGFTGTTKRALHTDDIAGIRFIYGALPTTPTVTNYSGASNIAPTSAKLNGEVTSTGGENPTTHIYWGQSDGGTTPGSWAHDVNLGVKAAGTFYTDISSLTAGTTYYYRCYAVNSGGGSWAVSTASFTTSSPPIPPTMEAIAEAEGHYYNTAPVLSNFGFDDDAGLDDGWYQMDSYTGSWTTLFTDVSGTSWDSDNWEVPGFGSLSEDSHTIYFKASDDESNVEGESGEWSWQFYKDTTPPTDPTGFSSSPSISTWSSDNTVAITWTDATDSLSGLDGYSILWDTNTNTIPDQTKNIEEGVQSANSTALADGDSHYFHIRSVDNIGNWQSTIHVGPFFIDTTPPTDPTGVSSTSHTTNVWSSDNTVAITWTDATDSTSDLDGYSILWNTDSATAIPDPTKNIEEGVQTANSSALADGNSHYFHIRSVDNAGNWQSTVHLGPFFIDTTPPTMEAIAEAEGQYYCTAPVFSNFGFDDNLALDDGWYQMNSYSGSWTALFTDVMATDVSDFAVASDNTTIYATDKEGDKLYKSTDAGVSWTELTNPSGATEPQLIAVAPDDANIVAIVADSNEVYFTDNGGTNWYSLGIPQESGEAAATALYDIAISAAKAGINYIAVAGIEAGPLANVWYFDYGAVAPAWTEINDRNGFSTTSTTTFGSANISAAAAFSPNFTSDEVMVAVTANASDSVDFQIFSFDSKKWNASAGWPNYPVTIVSDDGIAGLDSASISLAPTYLGSDPLMRIAFVGLTVAGDADAVATSGIYRLNDVTLTALKTGEQIHSVAYNGTNLVAGAYDTTNVWRSADPLATTPTVSSAPSSGRPGGDNKVMVAWAGSDVVAGTSGSGSAFAVSTDNGETFTDISLTGTSWDSDNWEIPGFGGLAEDSHTIYFKASDNASNVEGESGEWSWQFFATDLPVLSGGAVSPTSGYTSATFTYSVTYTDAQDDAPSPITVSIDGGASENMTVKTGQDSDFTNGEIYEYTTTGANLGVGSTHTFQFAASAGTDNATGDIGSHSGPTVSSPPAPPPAGGDGGGGGGGGGGVTKDKRMTGLRNSIGWDGTLWDDVEAPSLDNKLRLYIPFRTVALNKNGVAQHKIVVTSIEEANVTQEYENIVGIAYDLGPAGTTFEPPIILTIKYDASLIPEGVSEGNLFIANWDENKSEWIALNGTVDEEKDIITTKISHFSTYAVMASTSPAAFTTTDLVIAPAEVDIGESVTISVLVTNTGDLTGSYEVSLKIDDMVAQKKEITLDSGDKRTISFTVIPDTVGKHTININGLLGTFEVKVPKAPAALAVAPAPASFTISDLSVTRSEVKPAEQVTISTVVTNTGGSEGSYTVVLKINGAEEAKKEVTLGAGKSETVTFTIAKDAEGSYSVNIDGKVGQFTVIVPPPNWWLIGGIIAGCVVVVGLLVYFFVWRKRSVPRPS